MEGGKKQSTDTHWRCKNGQGAHCTYCTVFYSFIYIYILTILPSSFLSSLLTRYLFSSSYLYHLSINFRIWSPSFYWFILTFHYSLPPTTFYYPFILQSYHPLSLQLFIYSFFCLSHLASWNWRIKIPIELPLKTREMGRLRVQMWERNITRYVRHDYYYLI